MTIWTIKTKTGLHYNLSERWDKAKTVHTSKHFIFSKIRILKAFAMTSSSPSSSEQQQKNNKWFKWNERKDHWQWQSSANSLKMSFYPNCLIEVVPFELWYYHHVVEISSSMTFLQRLDLGNLGETYYDCELKQSLSYSRTNVSK